MTPIEKALAEPRGNYLTWDDWLKGVITAFLDAAAEDEDACYAITTAYWKAFDGGAPPLVRRVASRAAILALKGAVNG
jgi:hypothetical protein